MTNTQDRAPTTQRILLIDDCIEDVQRIRQMLSRSEATRLVLDHFRMDSFSVEAVPDFEKCDVVLFGGDLALTRSFDQFNAIRQAYPTKPVIILSRNPDEDIQNLALLAGAQDYLLISELNATALNRSIRYSVKRYEQQLTLVEKTEALQKVFLELKRANQKLRQLAMTDALTKVFNRRYFDMVLATEWSRSIREAGSISLILCDIDFFKAFNDTYGHQAGDHCLFSVAQAIASAVLRPADTVARYGGEEFAIILPNTDSAGALHVAQTIEYAIAQAQIEHAGSAVSESITMSFGVATYAPLPGMEASQVLESADQALYMAKEKGRNCIRQCAMPSEDSRTLSFQQNSLPSTVSLHIAS